MNTRHLFRKAGSFVMTALLLCGTFFVAAGTAEAQTRWHRHRRVVIVPYRVYRPFGWGWRGYDPYGWNSYYSHYVFDSGEKAVAQGYKDGFKTGKDDGKKRKSFSPERSHYFREAGFGNFGEVYRSAFSRGYAEGYRGSYAG